MKTKSESLFESFCDAHGFSARKIAEGKEESPDYEVCFGALEAIVEVKQIDSNANDLKIRKELDKNGFASMRRSMGLERIQPKISKANRQIKKNNQDAVPGVLVLFDTTGYVIDELSIKHSMFGELRITTDRLAPPSGTQREYDLLYGGKKKMTHESSRSISAIGHLTNYEELVLHLYHNPEADHPINPIEIRCRSVRHFVIDGQNWIEVKS